MIRGYRAEVDPRALGYALASSSASARRRASCARSRELARGDARGRRVRLRVTGEDCYVMRAHVRDVEHLEEVIDRFALYGQTTSSIMQSRRGRRAGIAL